jgi:hypothetical protein
MAHHSGIPVAAYAVPLSVLGILVLMTTVAFIVQRTRRAEQRAMGKRGPAPILDEKPTNVIPGWRS